MNICWRTTHYSFPPQIYKEVTLYNSDSLEYSGFTRAELDGADHNIVRHPDVPSAVFAEMWQHLKDDQPYMVLVKIPLKKMVAITGSTPL
jgi:hypothetical protein